jgi:transcriptional regulator with XRE-family HTH domain
MSWPSSEVADPSAPPDTSFDIDGSPEIPAGIQPSSLGAGELILVCRELTGRSQRSLAAHVGTSQPALARLETGNAIPTVRTLMRIAQASGFELVIGLRRPGAPPPDSDALGEMGFALLGTLDVNEDDGLADFTALREPSPLEGPR